MIQSTGKTTNAHNPQTSGVNKATPRWIQNIRKMLTMSKARLIEVLELNLLDAEPGHPMPAWSGTTPPLDLLHDIEKLEGMTAMPGEDQALYEARRRYRQLALLDRCRRRKDKATEKWHLMQHEYQQASLRARHFSLILETLGKIQGKYPAALLTRRRFLESRMKKEEQAMSRNSPAFQAIQQINVKVLTTMTKRLEKNANR